MLGVMVSLESVLAVILLGGLLLWSIWNWAKLRILTFQTSRPATTPANHRGVVRRARIYGIATNAFFASAFSGTSKIIHAIWRVVYKISLGILILTILISAGLYIANYMGVISL